MADADNIELEGHTIPLKVRRHGHARRISIRISSAKNTVILTLPRRASLDTGLKFLKSKADWVLKNIERDFHLSLMEGTVIPVLGKEYAIQRMQGRGLSYLDEENNLLVVFCQPEFIARRVRDLLKKLLLENCIIIAEELSVLLGKKPSKVEISNAGSRWGSCSRKGELSFSALLVFAPPAILRYLIAHEMAHLKEMNHSPRFWKIVEQLYPDTKNARKWLRTNGYKLHKYQP